MAKGVDLDGVLVTWGDRLFYPGNRIVKGGSQPKMRGEALRRRAAAIRGRIEATVVRRAPQVMVKVTGGGRCMRAIAAHFRYISKNGRLDIEDDRGETLRGRAAVRVLAEDWQYSGSFIAEDSDGARRREAFNIMLSMPRGTDPLAVQRAAREFAHTEFADHKYVMVLHDHQANPHVHISVRVESRLSKRLTPRKADLHRWRETFADKLREHGVDSEATRQATRGLGQDYDPLWRVKAREDGRLLRNGRSEKSGTVVGAMRAVEGWMHIGQALARSSDPADRKLAASIAQFVAEMSVTPASDRSASNILGPGEDHVVRASER
jgi:hypothetical protein